MQAIKCEMTGMNKRSHCIFEKARILALLVLKADLKHMSVKKTYLPYFEERIFSHDL